MFKVKGSPLEWNIEYNDLKDEKQAELMADLLNYYYKSEGGQKEFQAIMRRRAETLLEEGYVISEGTT